MEDYAAGHELGGTGCEREGLVDARPEVESRRAGGRVLRRVVAEPRIEDLYVQSLQAKSRLVPWQHFRDVGDQLAREHDLRRKRQLVHAVLVEERERVGVLAESLVREIRGKQGNSLLLALRLRVGLQILRLGGKADAKRPLL